MNLLKTGIDGLDEILKGGVPSGSSIILEGSPGSGKTLFGLQFICKNDEPSLFISLTEKEEALSSYSHRFKLGFSNLKKHKKIFLLTDASRVYKSMKAFKKSELQSIIKKQKIKRVVIDNLNSLFKVQPVEFNDILALLLKELKKEKVTCLMLKEEGTLKEPDYLAELIIKLETEADNSGKTLAVRKSKIGCLPEGKHLLKVAEEGLELFPNLDFLDRKYGKTVPQSGYAPLETGLSEMDELLGGGLQKGNALLISGSSGTGKSTLGLNFLKAGFKLKEKALYIGIDVKMEKLAKNAEVVDLDLKELVKNGDLEVLNLGDDLFVEEALNKIAGQLKDKDIERVMIDEIGKFKNRTASDLKKALKLLSAILREQTSLYVFNINDKFDLNLQEEIFELMDKVVLLKYTEIERKIEKIVYILKSPRKFDSSMRRLVISESGIHIGEKFETYQNILSGSAVKTEIKLVTFNAKSTEEIAGDFQKMNPDVKVEILDIPRNWESISYKKEKLATQKNIGVIPLSFQDVQILARDKLLLELDNVPNEEDELDFFSAGLDGCSYNGHLYAIPDDIKCKVIVYRKDLFRKYGMSLPGSWDELVKNAKYIVAKENNPKLAGFIWSNRRGIDLVLEFLAFMYSNGGEIYKKDNKIGLTEKNVTDTLRFMCDLIYKYKVVPPDVLVSNVDDRIKSVCEGNMLFYLCSSSSLRGIFKDAKCELGLMPVPLGPDGEEFKTVAWGFAYAIPRWTLYPQTSIALIKYFTGFENQVKLELAGGNAFSSRKKVCFNEEVLKQKPFYKYGADFLEQAKVINAYCIPAFEKIFPVLEETVRNALNNNLDAHSSMKSAQQKLKNLEIKPLYSRITNNVIEFLRENMHRPIMLDDVSEYLKISPSHLSKIFKEESSKTIFEYLTYLRIEKAKTLLKDIKLNMTDVGLQCGFTDLNYFSRIFKKINGHSPSEYRRKIIQQ